MISVKYLPKRDHNRCVANRKLIIIFGPGLQTGAKHQSEGGLSLPENVFSVIGKGKNLRPLLTIGIAPV